MYVMQGTLTDPKIYSISFEINLTIGVFTTLVVPILAKLDEPIPTITFCTCALLGIAVTMTVKDKKDPPK